MYVSETETTIRKKKCHCPSVWPRQTHVHLVGRKKSSATPCGITRLRHKKRVILFVEQKNKKYSVLSRRDRSWDSFLPTSNARRGWSVVPITIKYAVYCTKRSKKELRRTGRNSFFPLLGVNDGVEFAQRNVLPFYRLSYTNINNYKKKKKIKRMVF